MKYIAHRRNTISELRKTPGKYGIEVDIRSSNGLLITNHDPFTGGDNFQEWLKHYRHATLILNIKEEGLEEKIIQLMQESRINDYFFLDQSFPSIVKWSNMGELRCAIRVSEFESVESALLLAGKVSWVWIDCFTHFPLSLLDANRLIDAGFKLCVVSPELHGRLDEIEIPLLANLLMERSIAPDAICTKRPDIWEKFFIDVLQNSQGSIKIT
jgi:hypothetical protein